MERRERESYPNGGMGAHNKVQSEVTRIMMHMGSSESGGNEKRIDNRYAKVGR